MNKRVRDILRTGQRGFTLIELVAVMAILAILVAIVAPAAINSERASISAQAQADSQQVRNAASQFFTSKNSSEVRTPHKVTTTTKLSVTGGLAPTGTGADTLAVESDAEQEISSRWPELFITADDNAFTTTALYFEDIQTSLSTKTGKVNSVLLLDKNGKTIEGSDFLTEFTAIDLQTLVDGGYLNKMPDGVSKTSATGIDTYTTAPNFLWLFKKQNSSLGTNDDRAVAVFVLVKVEQIEATSGGGVATTVDLTYEQILGP